MGIGKGNKTQLEELVELLASGQVFSFFCFKIKKYLKCKQMCSIQNKRNQIAFQPPARINNDLTHVYSTFFPDQASGLSGLPCRQCDRSI